MPMTSDGNVKAERGAVVMVMMMAVIVGAAVIDGCGMVDDWRGRVDDWSWCVNDGSGLIDDRLLDHDGLDGLCIDDGGAGLLHDDLLRNHGSRLLHDYGSGLIDDRGRIHIDWR